MNPRRFAAALSQAVNEITRRTPAPRALPFFGIDHPPGCGTRPLDRLSELGIFRVYEHVLDLGSGLGGPARWLARRRGCRVLSVARVRSEAAASRLLTRRSHLESAVAVITGPPATLPVRAGAFTHAWSVEALAEEHDRSVICRELFRALRPGGHIALQEWLEAEDAETLREAVGTAGFGEVRLREVTDLLEDETTITEIVWERLGELVGEPTAAERSAVAKVEAEGAARRAAVDAGRVRLMHVVAQKPA